MSKVVYKRTDLEPELGFAGAQTFMSREYARALRLKRTKRAVRVFSGTGKHKVMDELIIVF